MYIGEYNHNVDDKGRVSLPARFRDDLSDSFYITKGLEGCLFIYDSEEWEKIGEKMSQLRLTAKSARGFQRLFYGSAQELSTDKQGRILIPANLREYADIEKEVVITGISDRIEIWDKDRFDTYIDEATENYEDIADQLDELDF